MKTTKEILIAARALIADHANWTQGALARVSVTGRCTGSIDPDAHCFCASGAVVRICKLECKEISESYQAQWQVLYKDAMQSLRDVNQESIININDSGDRDTAHAAVIETFDKAIAAEPE